MSREVLQQALEALGKAKKQIVHANVAPHGCIDEVIIAIKEDLAQPEQNQFKPDWNTEAVLVEEMQRMAKQLAEMQDWEAVASDQAMTIAMMRLEQEPVAWGFQNSAITGRNRWMMLREDIPTDDQYGGALWTPLYASPPQRQPMTDEQRDHIIGINCKRDASRDDCERVARAIEAKLKEKNA